MDQIGVRELRQHASRYLARVVAGEFLEITDRGRPVAMLVPIRRDPWRELVDSGRVTAPSDVTGLLADPPQDYGISASVALEAMRAHER